MLRLNVKFLTKARPIFDPLKTTPCSTRNGDWGGAQNESALN